MSKAILILDIPKSCSQCDFCEHQDEGWLYCTRCKKTARAFDKPDWCPLKELPQKQTVHCTDTSHHRFAKGGWNACISEILKGSEENE